MSYLNSSAVVQAETQLQAAEGVLNAILNSFDDSTLESTMPPRQLFHALRAVEEKVSNATKAISAC